MEDEEAVAHNKDYLLPASIVVAALLIAGAWVYTAGLKNVNPSDAANQAVTQPAPENDSGINILPISANDHLLGNPNAPVKIIEFSDLECPFCKSFHPTLKEVVRDYSGKVAWVYRHFPLDSLHPKARKEAEASECANELGGNEKFWAYIDRVFEVTPSNNGLDPVELPKIAEDIGLNKVQFQACLESGKYKNAVQANVDDAVSAGGRGTPYSVVIAAPNGKKIPLNGALPYAQVRLIVEEALR
ncbi:MAG: thioredoxin domain-containing protein [Candidatus Magasanikbacteria bacterium]|nr:thioredoxin domain-containing protein [Candidatus Magasanikbacteria bacterium]